MVESTPCCTNTGTTGRTTGISISGKCQKSTSAHCSELGALTCQPSSSSSSSSLSAASSNTISNNQRNQVTKVSTELEELRCIPSYDGSDFPLACQVMLYSLKGNCHCVDCGNPQPEWASVTYGVLLCVQCSGRHRSFGVNTSFVRSTYEYGAISTCIMFPESHSNDSEV